MEIELIINGILAIFKHLKEKHDWDTLFIACKEAVKEFDFQEKITLNEEVSRIFEFQDYKEIEKAIKSGKHRNLQDFISRKLIDLFISFDYEKELAEKFTQIIEEKLLLELRIKFPEEYNLYILESIDESLNKVLQNQKSNSLNIDKLPTQMSNTLNSDTYKTDIMSIDEIDSELKDITSPQIDLSFFDFKDEIFKEKLLEDLNNKKNVINVQGNSQEETLYAVLYELSVIDNTKKNVYVIKNINTWEKISKGISWEGDNKILIPTFYAVEIKPIKNNTNIFIYSVDQYPTQENIIELRNRISKDLHRLLIDVYENAKFPTDEVQELIDQTQGKFSALKRRLFTSMLPDPAWVRNDSKFNSVLHKALLLGSWDDSDAVLLQDFLGTIPYSEFMNDLKPYMNGEDPFLIKLYKTFFGGEGYKITCLDEAWGYLGKNIDDQLWNDYKDLCSKVLPYDSGTDGKLYSDEQNMSLGYSSLDPKCSVLLRKGLTNNLLESQKYYPENTQKHQTFINDIVQKVLNSINDRFSWFYFLNYSHAFAEASPSLVLKKFEKEISNGRESPLVQLFENSVYVGWNQPVNYIYILSTLTLYFSCKTYITRSIKCLCQLNALKLNLSFSNSPASSLRYLFCPWYHDNFLSVDQVKVLSKKVIEEFPTGWNIIAQELHNSPSDSIFGTPQKPKKNNFRELPTITTHDLNDIYQYYTKLCVQSADKDIERWLYLLEKPNIIYFDCKKTLEALLLMLQTSSDEIKDKIKNELRILLHKHRKFKNATWALPNDILKEIETTYRTIEFTDPIFKYTHMFDKYLGEVDLDINPEPWEENNTDYEGAIKKDENFVISMMNEFKEKNYSLEHLLEISSFDGGDFYLFGKALAKAYSQKGIDEELFTLLTIIKPEKSLYYYYVIGVYDLLNRKEEVILDAIGIAKKIKSHINIIVKLAHINYHILPNENLLSIMTEYEIKLFWETFPFQIIYNVSDEDLSILIEKSLQFRNEELFWLSMNKVKFQKGNEFCINLLERAIDNDITVRYSEDIVKKIFKHMYLDSNFKSINNDRIANLEFHFLQDKAFENGTCLFSTLKENPALYADAINTLFKHDDGSILDVDPRKLGTMHALFSKMKFCPGEKDGDISQMTLNFWVEEFGRLLEEQNQKELFAPFLGMLLARSPIGDDGYEPHESVREIIEKLSNNSDFRNSYITEKLNMRGIHVVSKGEEEQGISNRFKVNAEQIGINSPYTAEIYNLLADHYSSAAKRARIRAEQHT